MNHEQKYINISSSITLDLKSVKRKSGERKGMAFYREGKESHHIMHDPSIFENIGIEPEKNELFGLYEEMTEERMILPLRNIYTGIGMKYIVLYFMQLMLDYWIKVKYGVKPETECVFICDKKFNTKSMALIDELFSDKEDFDSIKRFLNDFPNEQLMFKNASRNLCLAECLNKLFKRKYKDATKLEGKYVPDFKKFLKRSHRRYQ